MEKNFVGTERILLRIPEAAAMLAISRAKLYELIRSGVLPVFKIGAATRIRVSDLKTWIISQKTHEEHYA